MRLPETSAVVFVAACLASTLARAGTGDLNRCIGHDGRSVYTDQPCASMDATVRPQAPGSAGSNRAATVVRVHVRDCAATLPALRDGIQAALAASDVNRFAAFFQWAGSSAREADAVLDRLQGIVARPLRAVSLVRTSRAAPADDAPGADLTAPAPPAAAIAIAIDQTRAGGDSSPMRTVLAVSSSMGCWWVHL